MEFAYTFLSKEQADAALRTGEAQGFRKGEASGIRKGVEMTMSRVRELYSWLKKCGQESEFDRATSSEQLFEQYWNEMQNSLKN